MDWAVRWTNPAASLRVYYTDPSCDPYTTACVRSDYFASPYPNDRQVLRNVQGGTKARRFVVENTSSTEVTDYSIEFHPYKAGCT